MEQSDVDGFNPDHILDQIAVKHACNQLEELMNDESFWKMTMMKVRYAAYVHQCGVDQGLSPDQAFELACSMTESMFMR